MLLMREANYLVTRNGLIVIVFGQLALLGMNPVLSLQLVAIIVLNTMKKAINLVLVALSVIKLLMAKMITQSVLKLLVVW